MYKFFCVVRAEMAQVETKTSHYIRNARLDGDCSSMHAVKRSTLRQLAVEVQFSCTHLTSYRVMKRRDPEVVCKYSRDGDTLVYIRTCSCTAGLEHEIAELFPGVLEKASTHPGLSRKASSAERPRMLTTKRFVRSVLI